MSFQQAAVFALLGLLLAGFTWGRIRYDLMALGALLAAVLLGLVPIDKAFTGFGHPAVVTVAAVLVISRAMRNAGIVDAFARRLIPLTRRSIMHVTALTGTVTVCSAFMNDVGALALLLPVAMETAARHSRPPSMLLMPLAFGSLVGGMVTLIGTPPNIIIASYRSELGKTPFGMFDFTPVGAVVAAAAVGFIALVGWRLIPARGGGQSAPEKLFQIAEYVSEVKVPEASPSIGKTLTQLEHLANGEAAVVGLIRHGERIAAPSLFRHMQAGDLIIVRADPTTLKTLVETARLELVADAEIAAENLRSDDISLIEAVITGQSALVGRTPFNLAMRAGQNLRLLALARRGQPMMRRLREARFNAGDVLLLQGVTESLPDTLSELGLLPLAGRDLRLPQPGRIGLVLAVFAAALALVASGLLPIAIAFLLAILAYVALDILPMRDLYTAIDWPIIVLLAALIPVGAALESSGGARLIAGAVVEYGQSWPPAAILALLMAVTMLISNIVNNAATAVLMAPIAADIAVRLKISADPLLMAVAVACSCAFLTPIGHQSNTLVMGPGGYRFGDYWRLGLPLQLLVGIVGVPMIIWVWPF